MAPLVASLWACVAALALFNMEMIPAFQPIGWVPTIALSFALWRLVPYVIEGFRRG